MNHRPPGPEPGALARLSHAPNLDQTTSSLRWIESARNRLPRRQMPLPNLLIPHNLPNFLDILYTIMVKYRWKMMMTASNMPMLPDTICTHVVFCLPQVTNHQFTQRPAPRAEGSGAFYASPDSSGRVTFSAIPFRFTLLRKNVPATALLSHSCKNKGLKVP